MPAAGTSRRGFFGILAGAVAAPAIIGDRIGIAICDLLGAPVRPTGFVATGGQKGSAIVMRIAAVSAEHAIQIMERGGIATPVEAVYDYRSPAALIDCCGDAAASLIAPPYASSFLARAA